MSRRGVIILIVAAASAVTAAGVASLRFVATRAGVADPLRVWIWIGVVLDALLLYAVFERRAPLFGRIVSRGRPRSPAIAITFDDGPAEPYTSQILDVLRQFGAKATFFVLGARVQQAPDVVRRAAREGHEIGNHTWDHAALPLRTPSAMRVTIRRTSDVVDNITVGSSSEPGSAPTTGRVGETPASEAMTDAGITAKVKARLLADPDVSGLRIDVDTRDGIVTLSGTVGSAAEKARAVELVGKVDNVARVEDRLTVRPR